MDLLAKQLVQSQHLLAKGETSGRRENLGSPVKLLLPLGSAQGQLKHSLRCENLADFSHTNGAPNQAYAVRPPWTPPPSPSPYGTESATETHAVGLAAERSISNGRR